MKNPAAFLSTKRKEEDSMRRVREEKQYLRNMCWTKEAWFKETIEAKGHGTISSGVWRGKPGVRCVTSEKGKGN